MYFPCENEDIRYFIYNNVPVHNGTVIASTLDFLWTSGEDIRLAGEFSELRPIRKYQWLMPSDSWAFYQLLGSIKALKCKWSE
jgi:hypothetical protein